MGRHGHEIAGGRNGGDRLQRSQVDDAGGVVDIVVHPQLAEPGVPPHVEHALARRGEPIDLEGFRIERDHPVVGPVADEHAPLDGRIENVHRLTAVRHVDGRGKLVAFRADDGNRAGGAIGNDHLAAFDQRRRRRHREGNREADRQGEDGGTNSVAQQGVGWHKKFSSVGLTRQSRKL